MPDQAEALALLGHQQGTEGRGAAAGQGDGVVEDLLDARHGARLGAHPQLHLLAPVAQIGHHLAVDVQTHQPGDQARVEPGIAGRVHVHPQAQLVAARRVVVHHVARAGDLRDYGLDRIGGGAQLRAVVRPHLDADGLGGRRTAGDLEERDRRPARRLGDRFAHPLKDLVQGA